MFNHIFSKKRIESVTTKLKYVNAYNYNKAEYYLTLKLIFLLIVFFVLVLISPYGLIISPIVTLLMSFLYDYYVFNITIKKRKQELENDAIIFFKALYFAYNSSNNLKQALLLTTKNINNELSKLFNIAINETGYGKNLSDALKNLDEHIPSTLINMMISNLSQAIISGSDHRLLLSKQIRYLVEKKDGHDDKIASLIPLRLVLVAISLLIPVVLVIYLI